jgi:hypothetical protein
VDVSGCKYGLADGIHYTQITHVEKLSEVSLVHSLRSNVPRINKRKPTLPRWPRKYWVDGVHRQMLGHSIPLRACKPHDLEERQLLPQMNPSGDFQ